VAVLAVCSKLPSVCRIPDNWENTGNFADFWLEMTEALRLSGVNSIGCERNSLAAKAGKICGRAGNPKAHNSKRAARLAQVQIGVRVQDRKHRSQ